jgi:hypothetical protein
VVPQIEWGEIQVIERGDLSKRRPPLWFLALTIRHLSAAGEKKDNGAGTRSAI